MTHLPGCLIVYFYAPNSCDGEVVETANIQVHQAACTQCAGGGGQRSFSNSDDGQIVKKISKIAFQKKDGGRKRCLLLDILIYELNAVWM